MPPWVQEGGYEAWAAVARSKVRDRVRKEMLVSSDDWENLMLAAGGDGTLLVGFKNDALRKYAGKTLAEVAAMRRTSLPWTWSWRMGVACRVLSLLITPSAASKGEWQCNPARQWRHGHVRSGAKSPEVQAAASITKIAGRPATRRRELPKSSTCAGLVDEVPSAMRRVAHTDDAVRRPVKWR
jgi:hypothetical protein